jgi:putative nucleotidyltransferase with HDIG domain
MLENLINISLEHSNWLKNQMNLIKEKPDLYDHSNRVAYLATELAKHIGIDEDKIISIAEAGLLHDCGKLIIPDETLYTGILTEVEKERLINLHVRAGFEIIKPYLPLAADIMVAHHEFQSRNYPRRINRESADQELEKMRKLLALADQTDSLLSVRSYKAAWSIEETRSYLTGVFDRSLVDFSISKRKAIIV